MMLKLTVLLLSLGLLTFCSPMHRHRHRLGFQDSLSSESSDSMESAETDQQVTPTSHAPGTDTIIRTPADFGQPNENGRSAVTVSLRDENTNVSVDVLTFIFNVEDEAGRSSAAGDSSGFDDEGMQADEPSVTQQYVTDEQKYRSNIVVKENKKVEDDEPESIGSLNDGSYQTPDSPNSTSTGDISNSTSRIYLPNQQMIDFNSDEALQSEMDDLSNDIQADEAFIASLDAAKLIEERTSVDSNSERKQASALSEPFYSINHGFSSNSEETGQVKSQVKSHKSNIDTNTSNTHDSGSDSQPTHLPEDETMSESLGDTQSQSMELSSTLTTVFHYLLGELGLRSVPSPLKSQSVAELMTSMEENTSTEAKGKGTVPRSDVSSVDSQKVRTHSGATLSPWVFHGVSSLSFSSEEQEDNDVSLVTDATVSSPVPSPEPLLNPLSAKMDSPKSSSSHPVYVNDGWPAADYSNFLNDFRPKHKYGYKSENRNGEWEHKSINSYNSGIPTDIHAYYETAEHDTAQQYTPAYSWEEAKDQSFPTENSKTQDNLPNEDHPMLTPDSAVSKEDVNSSSSETSRETTFQIPRATDVSPTDARAVFSNSLESRETAVGPDSMKVDLTVSSSSEEGVEPIVDSTEQSLPKVGSNSQENQNQTDTADWPEKELVHDSGVQQLELTHISLVQLSHNLHMQSKGQSLLFMDLTPESSSKEEMDQVSSTDAPGLIFSSLAPMSSEEQVSPASISSSTSLPGSSGNSESNEENENASLNHSSLHPAPSDNSSEDDQNEESLSTEISTDSPRISEESPPQTTSVSASDLIVSDEDPSSEIITPDQSTGLEITSQTSAVDANANVAKTSEESQESQEPSLSTLIPQIAINPSKTPHTKKSSEENIKMEYIANDHLHINPIPTATSPNKEEVSLWATFLQSLKAHMTPWGVEHGNQKVQRPWNKYGNRHHSSHYIQSNKGQKASSSEESK